MDIHRIVLANGPRLWRELLHRAIAKYPDLDVVGDVGDYDGIPSLLDATEVQWLVVSLTATRRLPQTVRRLLFRYPRLRVLAVASDGSCAHLGWQRDHFQILDYPSLDELITVLSR